MSEQSLPTALLRPQAYPHPAPGLRMLETHISWLFFAGSFVYKVKKPVDLGFVDFTELERRRHFCDEEVRLNRRLTEDLHLGVVAITSGSEGPTIEGSGPPIDWAVKMRCLDPHRMADVLLERGEVDNAMLGSVVERLVSFHREADSSDAVRSCGSPAAISKLCLDNLEALEPLVGSCGEALVSRALHDRLTAFTKGFLASHEDLFARRVDEGRIRDGHGDLHVGNICFDASGPTIYDCVEFSPDIRACDVAADLAFLAMDLDRRGFPGFGGWLSHHYAELAEDPELPGLMPFYKTYRALVRAKVAGIRVANTSGEELAGQQRIVRRATRLAGSYTLPPAIILMGGLPASGKSYLAARIDVPQPLHVIRSDVQRKRLAGLPPEARVEGAERERLYSSEMSARTYEFLLAETERRIDKGQSVALDATFVRRSSREEYQRLAKRLGVPCLMVWTQVSEAVASERMAQRAHDPSEPSDADLRVRQRLAAECDPLDEWEPARILEIEGTCDPEEASAQILDELIRIS